MCAHGYEIIWCFAGKGNDLFCAIANVHHRGDIFQTLRLWPLYLLCEIIPRLGLDQIRLARLSKFRYSSAVEVGKA